MPVRPTLSLSVNELHFPKEKVSYGRHLFARILPGFGGEPDLMDSEKPAWLIKIQARFSEKTDTVHGHDISLTNKTGDKKNPQIVHTETVSGNGESFMERVNRLIGR